MSAPTEHEESIRKKYQTLNPVFDERSRRYWAATEAMALGYGGIAVVARATGMSRQTISAGIKHIEEGTDILRSSQRIRRSGGGRKPAVQAHAHIRHALEAILEPAACTQAQPVLRWTCKSTRTLATLLRQYGHCVSHRTVSSILQDLGYRIQPVRIRSKRCSRACREAQFTYIERCAQDFLQQGRPIVAIDVDLNEVEEKLTPAVTAASLALSCLQVWWNKIGCPAYPDTREILLTVNPAINREQAWRDAFQTFSNDCLLTVQLCFFPPGISRWQSPEQTIRCRFDEGQADISLARRSVVLSTIAVPNTLPIFSKDMKKKLCEQETTCITPKNPGIFRKWNDLLTPQTDAG